MGRIDDLIRLHILRVELKTVPGGEKHENKCVYKKRSTTVVDGQDWVLPENILKSVQIRNTKFFPSTKEYYKFFGCGSQFFVGE